MLCDFTKMQTGIFCFLQGVRRDLLQTSVNRTVVAAWLPQLKDGEAYRKCVWSMKGDLEKHLY